MKYDYRIVKRLMVQREMNARQLGARAGLTHQAIYLIIGGRTEPKASTLGKLAVALEVPVDAFFKKAA